MPSLHRYVYAANRPTVYVDPTGREFTLNTEEKYGPNEVAKPVLSGTVSHEDFQRYQTYVGKHGSRQQVIAATLGGAGVYSRAYGQKVAKMEAAGAAAVVAAAPVAIAGGGAVATGAVAGGTEGFVSGLLDKASAKVVAARTATGVVLGAAFGWAAQKVGAWIAGEASPSVPGGRKSDSVVMKPAEGAPPPQPATANRAPKPADYDSPAAWEAYNRAHPEAMRSVGAAGRSGTPPGSAPEGKTLIVPKEKAANVAAYEKQAAEGTLVRTDPKTVRGSGFRGKVTKEQGPPPGKGYHADHTVELCVGGANCPKTNAQWLEGGQNTAAGAKIGAKVKDDPLGTVYTKVKVEE